MYMRPQCSTEPLLTMQQPQQTISFNSHPIQ
jgi:hypothetical protein